MSNPWAGKVAKGIAMKKRSRSFWNVFFGANLVIILFSTALFVYQILCDHIVYVSEQIYVECDKEYLVTDSNLYEIVEYDKQNIKINKLIKTVDSGEKIMLTISKIDGRLINVIFDSEIIYEKTTIEIPSVILWIIIVFPILVAMVFMLVVTNIKNPSTWVDKIQRQYLLRIYRNGSWF